MSAENTSVGVTSVTDTSRARVNGRDASLATRKSKTEKTLCEGITLGSARRWTADETRRMLGSRTHLLICEAFAIFSCWSRQRAPWRNVVATYVPLFAQPEYVILPYKELPF